MFLDNNRNKTYKIKYYLCFLIIFSIIITIIYLPSLLCGKGYIVGDSYSQDLPTLILYRRLLKNFLVNICNGRIVFPKFSLLIDEGVDILNSYHYYGIGDPISLFVIFFNEKDVYLFIILATILRMFLAGITFSELCFYKKINSRIAILIAALTYTFSLAVLSNVAISTYYINLSIMFPLLILGIDRVLKDKKFFLLIFTVFYIFITNVYFIFMIGILALIYTIVEIKLDFRKYLLLFFPVLIGALLGSFIWMPVVFSGVAKYRLEYIHSIDLLYPLEYYISLPYSLISISLAWSNGVTLLFNGLVVPSIAYIISSKKHHKEKIIFCIIIVLLIFPLFGQVLGGIKYSNLKFSRLFALPFSYFVALFVEDIIASKIENFSKVIVITILYALLFCNNIIIVDKYNQQIFVILSLLLVCIIIIMLFKQTSLGIKFLKTSLLVLSIWMILYNCFFYLNPLYDNIWENLTNVETNSKLFTFDNLSNIKNICNSKILKEKITYDSNFFRVAGDEDMLLNEGMITEIPCKAYYSSALTYFEKKNREDLAISDYPYPNAIFGFGKRDILYTLNGYKYYIKRKESDNVVPASFISINEFENFDKKYVIYKNQNYLPIIYCYDNYVLEDTLKKSDPVTKEHVMLDSCIMKKDIDGIQKNDLISDQIKKIDFKYDKNDKVFLDEKEMYIVNKSDEEQYTSITFKVKKDAEYYMHFKDLEYEYNKNVSFVDDKDTERNIFDIIRFNRDKSDTSNDPEGGSIGFLFLGNFSEISILTKGTRYYESPKDRVVYLGKSNVDTETTLFINPQLGKFTFDGFDLLECKNIDYSNKYNKFKNSAPTNITIENDKIIAEMKTEKEKNLFLSVTYSNGFSAYVNGKKEKIYIANGQYMAIKVPKGENHIEFLYERPYQRLANIISLFGVILMLIFLFLPYKFTSFINGN